MSSLENFLSRIQTEYEIRSEELVELWEQICTPRTSDHQMHEYMKKKAILDGIEIAMNLAKKIEYCE